METRIWRCDRCPAEALIQPGNRPPDGWKITDQQRMLCPDCATAPSHCKRCGASVLAGGLIMIETTLRQRDYGPAFIDWWCGACTRGYLDLYREFGPANQQADVVWEAAYKMAGGAQ